MLQSYKAILTRKQSNLDSLIQKYTNGVQVLEEAAILVQKLSFEVESMKPTLDQKTKEAEKTMGELVNEKEEAKKKREKVEEKEIRASEDKKQAELLEKECQDKLSSVTPLLEAARVGIMSQVKEKDLIETRSYQTPTTIIKTIMEIVLLMLGRKIIEEEHMQGKKRVKGPNYWKSVQEMLKNTKKVRKDLETFDKKKLPIPDNIVKQVNEKLDSLLTEKTTVQQSSDAMKGIYEWVKAILAYDKAIKVVKPIKEDLAKATEKKQLTAEEWEKSKKELVEIEAKRDELEDKFKKQNMEKDSLKQMIIECQSKFVRAQELSEMLKGEKKSWAEAIKRLKEENQNLFGDVVLSAGFLAYLGPFPAAFRKKILNQVWIPMLTDKQISCTTEYSLPKAIANQVEVLQWHIKGLPSDSISEENAVMMSESKKWPLMIDPQLQGTAFIRQRHEKVINIKQDEKCLKKIKEVHIK